MQMTLRMRQQSWLTLLLALLLAIATSGAAVAAGLTIAVSRTPLSLPFYVAETQGYFAAEGVQVALKEVIGGHRSFQQMLDGEADLATASGTVIMFNSFKRDDFAVVASFVTSSNDTKLILGNGASISSPQQLAGKRIGTVVGASSHYFLDTWLIFNGVDPKSIRLSNHQPEAMATALAKGEVDAVAIWEPFAFQALKAVPGTRLLPDHGAYVMSFNLIGNKKLLELRDDDLARVLRALLRAEQFIQSEPAGAQAILRARLKLDQDFIDWIWPHYKYRISLDQSLITTLEGEARWARQEKHVIAGRSPNYLRFLHPQPMLKLRPDRVTIGK